MFKDAVISDCGLYRYCLWRRWSDGPQVDFIMLNPSTADAENDDATIRRCIGFAKAWGAGSLRVMNLFAYRATSPKDMKAAADPVGPLNDWWLRGCPDVPEPSDPPLRRICAWGNHGSFRNRDMDVMEILSWDPDEVCPEALALTKLEMPKHPLYLPKDAKPFPYFGRSLQSDADSICKGDV